MTVRLVDRPERIVTEANATVADRAGIWHAVELAQVALNERALVLEIPAIAAYDEAVSAYLHLCNTAPIGGALRAQGWRRCVAAQGQVNRHAESPAWIDSCRTEVDALYAALNYYHEIGGSADRKPMTGGIA